MRIEAEEIGGAQRHAVDDCMNRLVGGLGTGKQSEKDKRSGESESEVLHGVQYTGGLVLTVRELAGTFSCGCPEFRHAVPLFVPIVRKIARGAGSFTQDTTPRRWRRCRYAPCTTRFTASTAAVISATPQTLRPIVAPTPPAATTPAKASSASSKVGVCGPPAATTGVGQASMI